MPLVLEFEQLWDAATLPPDVFAFLKQQQPADSQQWLAILLADQQRRWKTDRPWMVEDYLTGLPDLPGNVDWKLQLAIGEFEARHDTQRPLSTDEIRSRFPDLGDTLHERLERLQDLTADHRSSVNQSDKDAEDSAVDPDQIDRICDAFEAALIKGDTKPQIEDFLTRATLAARETLLTELLQVEWWWRRQRGEVPIAAEYASRFPEQASRIEELLAGKVDRSHRQSRLAIDPSVGPIVPTAFVPQPGPSSTVTFITSTGVQQKGRYRLDRILGEGAFGRVYLGFDEELHRQVAIKVPTKARFKKPEDAEAYLAEARTVASLDHPHIVSVYDMGRTEDGSIYVVSKFIEGSTLEQRIKAGRLPERESTQLLATVALALQHAHERRLIHRDVKPANILLDGKTNAPYVADFGLAVREEDCLKQNSIAGTPAYMSPEQIRGEGHRLDGRSDIFSLGVILYESLTGEKPFRGSSMEETLHLVLTAEPRPPRELLASIPAELERISLKALSKRVSDRYATAAQFADDLQQWLKSVAPLTQVTTAVQVAPKGLRSFDAGDAGFFLELLPGQRNRDGLPESIGFWKQRIEQIDPEQTFSVGLIYGPSGCGKSSLVKAGLLPHLSDSVIAVYVEATPEDTETRILRGLRKRLPELSEDLGLADTLAALRRGQGNKVVIIIDQFEQWLHAHRADADAELVKALRQCDGGRVQAIVMVRDDFVVAVARLMSVLDIPILQGQNFTMVDLFDRDHAANVLTKFGQAFGKLPSNSADLSPDEQQFVATVADGLGQDGKVVSVRLSLFAEMVKSKPWTTATLKEVGGTDGIGVNFLEETFGSPRANPQHRLHAVAARGVLQALLPGLDTDIKGGMRSEAVLRILDGELRLITPTDPEGLNDSFRDSSLATRYYQLTHDYMVPSLRDWLTRKQQETRAGRAELKLAERTNLWTAKPENRYLPSIVEWGSICTLTDRAKWTSPQRVMMRRAGRIHSLRWGIGLAVALLIGVTTQQIFSSIEQRNLATRVKTAVASLNNSRGMILPPLTNFEEFPREPLVEELRTQFAASTDDRKLPLAYTLSHFGYVDVDFLVSQVSLAQADENANFLAALGHEKERALVAIDSVAKTCDTRAAEALATSLAAQPKEAEVANAGVLDESLETLWRYKARLAMLSLQLGSPSLAADMCRLRPDPIQRTVFIDQGTSWCVDLLQVSQAITSSDDGDLRSAICLVVGSVPPQKITAEQRKLWESILTNWHQHQNDTGTHSASGWALRKWGLPLPTLTAGLSSEVATSDRVRQWRVNSLGLTTLRIPAGEVKGEGESVIQVSQDYFLGDREITVGQFQQFIDDPNYPADEKPKDWPGVDANISPTVDHPAQRVTWYDAVLFCNWLSRRERLTPSYVRTGEKDKDYEGKVTEFDSWRLDTNAIGYRLPTAAEWEYACRAGTMTKFSNGNSETMLARYCQMYPSKLSAVCGGKLPNGWGLFDVHGNVWEWCEDSEGDRRFISGGCWAGAAALCGAAYRSSSTPTSRNADFGFRLALSPSVQSPEAEQVQAVKPAGGGTERASAEQRPKMP
jgi:serine/threonine protein kinase/formylglycine-generating enzyme required for sulfatase activity